MTVEVLTAFLLIVVPIAFNVAFFELSRAFDYPDILRRSRTRSCGVSMPAEPALSSAGRPCW